MAQEVAVPTTDMTCFYCPAGAAKATRCSLGQALAAIDKPDTKVWINLLGPTPEDLDRIAGKLGFHELAVEDVFSPHSHAKVEPYPSGLFCVVPALNLTTCDDLFDVVNLNVFLGSNYVVTAQRAPLAAVATAATWLDRSAESLLRGPDFIMYQLIDVVVDEYLDLSEKMTDAIDSLEERIFGTPDRAVSQEIFDLRHKAAWMRRLISPQREILNILTNRPHEFVSRETQLYLRDVYDHVQRVRENSEIFHDLLQGSMETYLTLVANRTNEVMKLLAAVGTIVLPINVVTGLYGTNFDVLPGSGSQYGFWVLCGMLIAVAGTMALIFRSRKWL